MEDFVDEHEIGETMAFKCGRKNVLEHKPVGKCLHNDLKQSVSKKEGESAQ